MTTKTRRIALAFASSALLFFFGTGLHPAWPLLWIAPIPALWYAVRATSRATLLFALGAWTAGQLNLVSYVLPVLPISMVVLLLVAPGLVLAAAVLLYRAAYLRQRYVLAPLLFGATWCTFEWVIGQLSPHGSFGSLGYTQIGLLPIAQLASLAGVSAISFVLLTTAAALAVVLETRSATVGIVYGSMLAAALSFGAVRLIANSPSSGPRVAAVANDDAVRFFGSPREADTEAAFETFESAVDAAAARGASIVVIPEKVLTTADLPATEVRLSQFARRHGVALVAGLNVLRPTARNLAVAVARTGEVVIRYDKRRLIPGLEAEYVRGDATAVFPLGSDTVGLAICKDLDFPSDIRRYAGVSMLLVPAWDFTVDADLHAQMAIMRGIENGFTVVRAATRGNVSVSDPFGRSVSKATNEQSPAVVSEAVRPRVRTLYAFAGGYFGWLVSAALVASLVGLLANTKPHPQARVQKN